MFCILILYFVFHGQLLISFAVLHLHWSLVLQMWSVFAARRNQNRI